VAAFTHDVAVVPCAACGALVEGPPGGGEVACGGCGAAVPFPDRRATLPGGGGVPGPQDPRLRAQDGKPLLPPTGIAFLWEGGTDLPRHRLEEARAAWVHARARAAAGDVAAGEELVFLGRELASAAEKDGDRRGARALLEATLLAAPVPRQRAVALGALVRMAVRAGEPAEALAWWEHFAAGAGDLESDSEWRVSTAVVKAAEGDPAAILRAIGEQHEQVALQDALDFQAVLFRAHALERSGRRPAARAELERMLAAGGPPARDGFERLRSLYADLDLCGATLPAVLAERERQARKTAGCGRFFLAALLLGSTALVCGGTALVPVGQLAFAGLPRSGSDWAGLVAPPGIGCLTTAPFLLWGIGVLVSGVRERRTFARGVRAKARVLSATPTGTQINDQPEMRIAVEVLLDPPVKSELVTVVSVGQLHALTPGTTLFVRIDPSSPAQVVLDG
jgi:hypothetical protein